MSMLSVQISPAAWRTIREAFTDLDQTISRKDSADFAGMTLESVIRAAHEVEDHLATSQSLRNMRRLTPLFTGLEYYSKSIKFASDYVEAFEKIIRGYARIAEPLAKFKTFNQTYSENLEVQQVLAVFYSNILKFHKQAYKFVRRSGWKVFFMTSWSRFVPRFDAIIDDLKAHESLIGRTANTVGLCELRRLRENIETLRQESLSKIAKEEEEHSAMQYVAIVGWLKMDDSEQLKIFDDITVATQKYPGTCDWIEKQDRVAAWMRCNYESTFLVLQGNPGTGKSVLLTKIAASKSLAQSLVISHFCTYSQPASTEYDNILRSILLQLARSDTEFVAYIFAEFILCKKPVTVQALERLILTMIGAMSDTPSQTTYVHVILDGLDECDKGKQLKIVNLLERMVSTAFPSGTTICKVLVASNMASTAAKRMKQKHVVSLSLEKVALEEAIKIYAAHRLRALQSRWYQMGINDSELKQLESQLAKKADGMFLWARLVLEYLSTNMLVDKSEVMGAVDTLPEELSDFYKEILTRLISHFDSRSVRRLRSIFGWIAFAKRPLRKAELRSALSWVDETGDTDVYRLAPNYWFEMCAPLLEERSDATFAFIHVSVKQYLQSAKSDRFLDEFNAVYEQGFTITSCLLSGLQIFQPIFPEQTRFLRVLRGFHGLHIYASAYWAEYVLSAAASEKGLNTDSSFFFQSCELATKMNNMSSAKKQGGDEKSLDSRLAFVEHYPELRKAIADTAAGGATKALEGVPQTSKSLYEITGLSELLHNYQHTVRALLHLPSFPGASIQELERFKQDFRLSAFTCRFKGCPFSGTGFDDEGLRNRHEEQTHAPRIACEVPGCQYPPFASIKALKAHNAQIHNPDKPEIRIKVPHITSDILVDPQEPAKDGRAGTSFFPNTPNAMPNIQFPGPSYPYVSNDTPQSLSSLFEHDQFKSNFGKLSSQDLGQSMFYPSAPQLIPPQVSAAPYAQHAPHLQHLQQDFQSVETASSPGQTSPASLEKTPATSIAKKIPSNRDHTANQLNATGDEYLPREIDESGEGKVEPNGTLNGGREYRCRTFLVPNRGDKLFMLSTECARVLGYRDPYLLFNKNRSLFKIVASQAEKDDLVQQEILPFSYRSRQISIMTARSMFRQFGSRVIVNGRRVRDDYWETKARKQGFTEADLASSKRPGAAGA
ncbi:chromatin remodelling complex Rsc7/Swp82 subunit-domain-containing protein [Fusarium tricinctum]|uniref:Chromatin remodelling complex Rsc7/Swp82 subunit-domain-containing protein n=1 Tax=Fusarium tricinctum TaxID=61284 RepID=A0A8K0RZS3_9HYPO|nr:chromatin remodelling complex Rsc7/Swp82 subunit-domain-containing protein [Fusarium tricinctum]